MNTNHTPTPDVFRDKILARIERGEVRMRPRLYFVLQLAVVLLLCVLALGLSIFLINFIAFTLRIDGHQSLLGFGPQGIVTFFFVFPWGWFILDIVLIGLVALLVRRFRFGYRRSVLYAVGALFLVALVAGVALDRGTRVNDDLLQGADHDTLPSPLGELYELVHAGPPHDRGIFRGIVSSIGTTTLTITHDDFDHDADDGTFIVTPPSGFNLSTLSVGDDLYIAGTSTSSGIFAYGIQKLPPK